MLLLIPSSVPLLILFWMTFLFPLPVTNYNDILFTYGTLAFNICFIRAPSWHLSTLGLYLFSIYYLFSLYFFESFTY